MAFKKISLTSQDVQRLKNSYITEEIAKEAYLFRTDSDGGAEIVGRKATPTKDYSGLVFPYIWPGEVVTREFRLRRDNPELERQPDGTKKEKNKYLSPPGKGNLLYFGPGTSADWLDDAQIGITITEGEKKTLALVRYFSEAGAEMLVIGLSGVWNWRGTIGKETNGDGKRVDVKGPIPDLDRIKWENREVSLIFDVNAKSNDSVAAARRQLAKELRSRGAKVRVIELPDSIAGVNGVDDLLAAKGPEFLTNLLKSAKDKSKQPIRQQVGGVVFAVADDGVFAIEEDGTKIWVCSELRIEADTRDEHSENWGRLLWFKDRDGVVHKWAMPMSLLAQDGAGYREFLLTQGLVIAPGPKPRRYLEMFMNTKPDQTALCVTRQGWHNGKFIFPDETIGEQDQPVYLQSQTANHLFRQSGTVEEWRDEIGRHCAGNTRLVLAACVAFVAPLLEPLRGESGGWHFTGSSSTGKTTALYLAGSIWGGGGDKGFIRRWRATINGLETVAEAHHDALLCLDEIAECKPDDVNEAGYMLANGQGKARQQRSGGLRRTPEWRLAFLSSGEVSIADHVALTGKRVRAGQQVRIVNLPADAEKGLGLFEDLHGFANGDEFARHLQRASKNFYGTPMRDFLKHVAGEIGSIQKKYAKFEADYLKIILPKNAASEVSRVAHRFLLAAFAGELATEYGITGWQQEEGLNSIIALFRKWIDLRGTVASGDEELALRQVRAFLEQHGQSRFQRLDIEDRRPIQARAGYIEPDEELDDQNQAIGVIYYILPETFRSEVCKGFDPTLVAKMLDGRGCLITNTKLQCQKRLPEGRATVYAIRSAKLQ